WLPAAGGDASVEGDVEGVQCRLPAVGPAGSALAGGVEAGDGQVQDLQGGLVGGEVPAGVDRTTEPGVETLDRVGGTHDLADLDVEGEERCELPPGVGPQSHDRRVLACPLAGELGERVEGGLLVDGRVDR